METPGGRVGPPSPRRIWYFLTKRLRLKPFFKRPGDGRIRPRILARDLLWGQVVAQLLREHSFHGIEALVSSDARRNLLIGCRFGDDALGYFNSRLDPTPLRQALAATANRAKRNKAFARAESGIGLAIDGTGGGRRKAAGCELCHPSTDSAGNPNGHNHKLCMVSVVGVGMTLPLDVEPYGPGDSEYAAGGRLLERVVRHLGKRFADHVVVDAGFATAPFLHIAGEHNLRVVARLKGNLPELFNAARGKFESEAPHQTLDIDGERVEIWDCGDFDPWDTLTWRTVRVLRYRQHTRGGPIVDAYWLTDYPQHLASSAKIYKIAKSRWEIENQGFNEAKTYHGFEHITHHDARGLLISWLIICFALTIERLFRLRYLRRGTHRALTAIELVRMLWLQLGTEPKLCDTG